MREYEGEKQEKKQLKKKKAITSQKATFHICSPPHHQFSDKTSAISSLPHRPFLSSLQLMNYVHLHFLDLFRLCH